MAGAGEAVSEQLLTPPTQEYIEALLVQVSLIPKKCRFEWRDAAVGPIGGTVSIWTNAGTPTIAGWFRKVGMTITRFDRKSKVSGWVVYFRVMPMGEGQ